MQNYQTEFIRFAMQAEVLKFGKFTLKSGRLSPYFFDSGQFNDGERLLRLGQFYARAIQAAGIEFDMVFGPAYKGIPLVASVAIAYSQLFKRNLPYCFDRKEEKDHGEGGLTLGARLSGRVLIIDDVITAGTSVNHAVELIRQQGAEPAAVIIALDRQERGEGGESAINEIGKHHNLEVIHIIDLADLIRFLSAATGYDHALGRLKAYRNDYGA